jgi:uncharacterized paraquat-inducible protein A
MAVTGTSLLPPDSWQRVSRVVPGTELPRAQPAKPVERPVPAAGRGGLVCAHCGFASAHERAFYCPKCGMRLLRG